MSERVAALLPCEEQGIVAAYLFGSFGRDEARESSDVDLALLYASQPARQLDGPPQQVQDRLERALGREVDVLVLNTAPPDLAHRVLRDGILLVDRDPSVRIQWEVKIRNEYADLLPVLRLYRRSTAS